MKNIQTIERSNSTNSMNKWNNAYIGTLRM